jgi:tetratricopeptide (TPR) repeat protein
MFREALNIEEELSNSAALAWIHLNLGLTAWFRSCYDEALTEYKKSLDFYQVIGDRKGIIQARHGLGKSHLIRNELDAAEVNFLAADKIIGEVQDFILAAWHGFFIAALDHARGRIPEAVARLGKVLKNFQDESNRHGEGWVLHFLGEIALSEGKVDEAEEFFRKVLVIATESSLKPMVLEAWLGWAGILAARGQYPEALEWVEAVLIQNACTGVTRKKAEQVREECARTLSSDEREYARLAAAAADLDLWSRRILETAGKTRTKGKTSTRKKTKPAPRKKRRPRS